MPQFSEGWYKVILCDIENSVFNFLVYQ